MNRVLRAALVMGSSSVVTIAAGVARNKVAAVSLGPEGVGTLGLLATALAVASTAFALGLGQSGVRQIAQASGQEAQPPGAPGLLESARALVWGTFALGGLAAILVFALREPVAQLALRDPSATPLVSWLALGTWASVAVAGLTALVNGLNRIRLLALVNVWGAVLGSVVAIGAVWLCGRDGLGLMVVAPPVFTWLAALVATRNVLPSDGNPSRAGSSNALTGFLRQLRKPFARMARLGIAVSLGVLVSAAVQFGLRVFLERGLGLDAAGQFQAAWNISAVYLGFVLGALGAEFFPRLSRLVHDRDATNQALNEQIALALTLATPVILIAALLAPEVVHLLYATGFSQTAGVLRWQLAGDVFKIVGWALAYLLLAREAQREFLLSELAFNIVFLGLAVLAIRFGLKPIGIAYAVAYLVYAVVTAALTSSRAGFVFSTGALRTVGASALAVSLSVASLQYGSQAGWWVSLAVTLAAVGFALTKVVRSSGRQRVGSGVSP